MKSYKITHWIEHDRLHQIGLAKELVYRLSRPMMSAYASQFLSKKIQEELKPSLILPGRGMSIKACRLWGSKLCDIRKSTILVQGTGSGWDVISWARLMPKRIIATDLFDFSDSWSEISEYCFSKFRVKVEFYQAPLEDHSFLPNGSVDLCASDAVLEHCKDIAAVFDESYRVLKSGGSLYASYGPLWFAPGGDHFSGRGGLHNIFNHLLLNKENYWKYFCEFQEPSEDFQSGGRYVELDLFSRLTTRDYCELALAAGFSIDQLVLYVNPVALKFRKVFPTLFEELIEKYKHCYTDDFLISNNLLRLNKL
jgi:SAM-dependent methyltransferase